ncbi:S9 family peptidase, partial [bacterium]|nr:S9 family peptidase [bacterium]
MKKIFLFSGLFLLLTSICFSQTKRNLMIDDYFKIQQLDETSISPDGKWIAYVVRSFDLKKDKSNKDLYMVPNAGGDAIRLTSNEKNDTRPKWSPDNRYLAFLSTRGKKAQVFLLNRTGGEAVQLTDVKQGVNDLEWSPDSKKLAIIITDKDPDELDESEKASSDEDKAKTEKPIVITRLQFKRDVEGYLKELYSHIYTIDIASKNLKQITSGNFDDSWPKWSPDGKNILFVSNRTDNPDGNRNTDLFLVPAEGGELKKLTTNPGGDENPSWSPDGKWITYQTTVKPELMWYDTNLVAVIPSTGGEPKILTRELDRNGTYPVFGPDNKTIYFLLEDHGTDRITSVPASGGTVNRDIVGENEISDFDIAPDMTIAFLADHPDLPDEVFTWSPKSKSKQITFTNAKVLEPVKFGKLERIQFKSKDGTPVEGFVILPPDFDQSKKYPLILRIHGGPVSQYQEGFSFEWQILAANGYVVVSVNPRGSSGYGEEFCKAIWADWGNKDFEDVMAGVDYVVSKGYVDPEKMGVGGWSYGGILTDYVITKTTRFKAAIAGASEANHFTGYGTDHYQFEWEKELGLPWENFDLWHKLSAFFNVTKVKTPTLFVCGQSDWNVPLVNSEQMYQALRRLGIDTMLIIYPDQSHSITTPSYIKDRFDRYLAWYGHYLQGKP